MLTDETLNLGSLNPFHCVKSGEVVTDLQRPVGKSTRCHGLQTGFVASSIVLKGVKAVNDKE